MSGGLKAPFLLSVVLIGLPGVGKSLLLQLASRQLRKGKGNFYHSAYIGGITGSGISKRGTEYVTLKW